MLGPNAVRDSRSIIVIEEGARCYARERNRARRVAMRSLLFQVPDSNSSQLGRNNLNEGMLSGTFYAWRWTLLIRRSA